MVGDERHLNGAGENGGEPLAGAADGEPVLSQEEPPELIIEEAHTVEAEVVDPGPLAEPPPVAEPSADADEPLPDDPSSQDVIHLEDAEMLPVLARAAADAWLRMAIWGLGTSIRAGARLARAATDPEAAVELYQDVTGGVRDYAREFLGITDLDEQVRQLTPLAGATIRRNGRRPELDLRAQGEALLRQAADVSADEGAHPAYARILTELAPDEARILRVLATEGPQPMVDIRAANLIGVGSQLIAPGLNMIGAQAGLRRREKVPAYLDNLLRLGLISLSEEALDDPITYQVLEAQPEVLGTIKDTARAKSVHRSIRLTPFGTDFCRVCLPLEATDPTSARSSSPGRDHSDRAG